jgi:acetyl esterase/lipase
MLSMPASIHRTLFVFSLLVSLTTSVAADPSPVVKNLPDAVMPPHKPMTRTDGPDGTTIIHDLEIAKLGDFPLLADMAFLKGKSPTPRPVMYIIHGGGWVGGSKNLNLEWAKTGYFVFSVDYRLSKVAKWPAQIEDCKLALRWLRAHATEYNINPNKVGVYGHSAGGHLACCMATLAGPEWDVGGYKAFSSAVQCVVDLAGPTDLTTYFKGQPRSVSNLFGQAGLDDPRIVAEASPVNHVRSGLPPFLILHGDNDKAVPISQAEKMVETLKKHGTSVQFITVHNAGHSFGHAKDDPTPDPTNGEQQAKILTFMDQNLKAQ